MLKLLIRLCVLTIGLCYATTNCHDLQKSQLASLNERITQILGSLYPPPHPSITPSESSSNDTPTNEYTGPPYEAGYYPYPLGYTAPMPQVIYVSPPPTPQSFSYPPPSTPNLGTTPQTASYLHLEPPGRPLDPYRGYPGIAPNTPSSHHYEPYRYPFSLQYSSPPPAQYTPPLYPSTYPHSWEHSSPYPEYNYPPSHPPNSMYSPATPTSYLPSYQQPPRYHSSLPYYPPPYYPNQPEMSPPPYYA